MASRRPRLGIIVATRNRSAELRRMLTSLNAQTVKPRQLLIIDSSDDSLRGLAEEFPRLALTYVHSLPPNAARQRNLGLNRIDPDVEVTGFLDDDVVLERDALRVLSDFFRSASSRVGGAAMNLTNHPRLEFRGLKHSRWAEKLGLYSRANGTVLPSGFQTMAGTVEADTRVQWLCSTAVFWRREVLRKLRFDEWFQGYSYLEDLDMSYRAAKTYDLIIVSRARFEHLPSRNRIGRFEFGTKEVLNRIHFVRKNPDLSLGKCVLALGARSCLSLFLFLKRLDRSFLARFLGNLYGFVLALMGCDHV